MKINKHHAYNTYLIRNKSINDDLYRNIEGLKHLLENDESFFYVTSNRIFFYFLLFIYSMYTYLVYLIFLCIIFILL